MPPKKRSKAPLVVGLGVVALVVVAAIAVVAVIVLGGGDPEPGDAMEDLADDVTATMRAQDELATAVVAGDAAGIEERRSAVPTATPATLDAPTTATLNGAGLAALTFDAAAGEGYSIAAVLDGGDAQVSTAVLPAEGAAVAPASLLEATADGPTTVLVAVDGEGGGEVSVTVRSVEITPVDVTVDETFEGDIAEPGDMAVYTVETEAGDPYVVDLDELDLTITVIGPDGEEVAVTEDPTNGKPRFEAATTGPYQVRIWGGDEGTTGSYSLEIYKVPDYYFFYESDDDELQIDPTVEEFQPLVDTSDNRAHVCLFLREGISMDLDITPTDAALDLGIDVFDETESGPLVARVNDNGPGLNEAWTVTADEDVVRCFQLWAVDYTGGGFDVGFTTSG